MPGNRNAHCGEQREVGRHRRAGGALHSAGYRECDIGRNRKASPQATHPYVGCCMKPMQTSVLLAFSGTLLIFTGTMSLSCPTSAAEKSTETTESAAQDQ